MFSFLKESNIKICSVSLFFCRAKVETVTVKRLVLLFSHWRRVKTISTSLSITHIGIFLRLWRRILSDLKLGLFEDWRSSFCLQARSDPPLHKFRIFLFPHILPFFARLDIGLFFLKLLRSMRLVCKKSKRSSRTSSKWLLLKMKMNHNPTLVRFSIHTKRIKLWLSYDNHMIIIWFYQPVMLSAKLLGSLQFWY